MELTSRDQIADIDITDDCVVHIAKPGTPNTSWKGSVLQLKNVFSNSSGVKVLELLITQSGTADPEGIVLTNDFDSDPIYQYDSNGQSSIILPGAFPDEDKTFMIPGQSFTTVKNTMYWNDANTLVIKNGEGLNGKLYRTAILIKVYP